MDSTYISDGTKTLSSICQSLSISRDQVTIACQTKSTVNQSGQLVSLSEYLINLDLKGQKIPRGVEIYYRETNSGGLENPLTKYNITRLTGGSTNVSLGRDFNCYMYVLLNGSPMSVWDLPVFPQEFSDSNAANFSAVSLLGRSVDYQIYQGSSRDVSFTIQLHEEICNDYSYIHRLVAQVQSACYPGYSGGIVQVPEIFFSIGSHFKIRGILTSCSAVWKAPIIDGKLVNCDLSVSIRETTGPYTQGDVARMGGNRS